MQKEKGQERRRQREKGELKRILDHQVKFKVGKDELKQIFHN